MLRSRGQQGSALLLIIGVVAALAVLASALVVLTVNAAGNTARDRDRAKAFNVAEALIDHALSRVGQNWPFSTPMTFDATEQKKFTDLFATSEFGTPTVSITYFDDKDQNGVPPLNRLDASVNGTSLQYDVDGNGLLYIEAQAQVGKQKARIQIEARESMLDMQIPGGVAVATNGNVLDPNSGSSNGNYAIGCDPQSGGVKGDYQSLSIWAGGDHIEGGATYDGRAELFGTPDSNGVPSGVKTGVTGAANTIVTPAILQSIIASAKMAGGWYSDIPSEQAAGAKAIPDKNDAAAWEGTVVVETMSQIDLASNGVINGDGVNPAKKPGLLVVIGPATMYPGDASKTGKSGGIKITGSGTYYGLIYTDGGVDFMGTMAVIGMVVTEGDVSLNGARCVQYNDNVRRNLNSAVQVNAQTVPDTWRQIQPL